MNWSAYLRLLRLGNVFTAWADVLAAILICTPALAQVPWARALLVLAASSCLYLGGMVLNDVFDVEYDRQTRPDRPIPSGQISRKAAGILGAVLLAAGLGAAILSGPRVLAVAAWLAVAIVAYDAGTKWTIVGPILMGICRTLNFTLGLALFEHAIWLPNQLHVPLVGRLGTAAAVGLGLYVMSLTRFARYETTGGGRIELTTSLLGMNLGLLMAGFVAVALRTRSLAALQATELPWADAYQDLLLSNDPNVLLIRGVWWIALAAVVNASCLPAILSPQPRRIQATVRWLLIAIILYDAAVVSFVRGPTTGAIVAALILPTVVATRFLPAT